MKRRVRQLFSAFGGETTEGQPYFRVGGKLNVTQQRPKVSDVTHTAPQFLASAADRGDYQGHCRLAPYAEHSKSATELGGMAKRERLVQETNPSQLDLLSACRSRR